MTTDDQPLAKNQQWDELQPTPYSWGDSSVGSEQLALSLMDSTDETHALILGQDFVRDVVSMFNDCWEVTSTDIKEWCEYKSELHGLVEESDWSPIPDTGTGPPNIPKLSDPNYRMHSNPRHDRGIGL